MLVLEHDQVRGLTLWRPWPWAFTHADKRVENRPVRPPRKLVGMYLALHSGLKFDADAAIRMREGRYGNAARACRCDSDAHPHTEITCVGKVDAVSEFMLNAEMEPDDPRFARNPWAFGRFVIDLPTLIVLPTPVPCRGAQGYWRLPPDVFEQVRDQVAEATRKGRSNAERKAESA